MSGIFGKLKADRDLRVLGIDLGTTNSTVTEARAPRGRTPEARTLELDQPTPDGVFTGPLVPSVVALLPSGGQWVGEGAKRLRASPREAGLQVEKSLFYETKNEMGLRKSYHRAPETHDRPWKIAGHVLEFLRRAAGGGADRVVVTVPASFQLNQRADTLMAAAAAGLDLKPWDLLDEPTAALLHYLQAVQPGEDIALPRHLLVLDFGGGTCDVSVIETARGSDTVFEGALRMTSRYHRLGGGDLDAAIVHEVLIPDLLAEAGMHPRDLTWSQKKKGLEPQLLGAAEALKIALCREIDRLVKFGRYGGEVRNALEARQPPVACALDGRTLTLSLPRLSALRWEALLEPFLDPESLYLKESEFRLTQSIFAPVRDALDRAGLRPSDPGAVLLAGGSTLIPHVRDAVARFFPSARIWAFDDPLDAQLAVSCGAAWHAWWLEVSGRPFIRPVAPEAIALVTEGGRPCVLVPAGSPLPFPPDGSFTAAEAMEVPRDVRRLRMEVTTQPGGQTVFNSTWELKESARAGDSVEVLYRLGPNAEFEVKARLAERPGERFEVTVENPLCNVLNPGATRLRIEETEERLRQKGGPTAQDKDELVKLSDWYAELRHLEKAQEFLSTALRLHGRPECDILNKQGILYGMMGDAGRQERAYLDAAEADPRFGGPLFNLALVRLRGKEYVRGLEAIDRAAKREPGSAPMQTVRGLILQGLGRTDEARKAFETAHRLAGPLTGMDEWELHWHGQNAEELGDPGIREGVEAERERRRKARAGSAGPDAARPVLRELRNVVN
jgi:molecular chaperone DnaK (HSP70)